MMEIQLRELNKMMTLMTAMNCQFKIITPDGQEFGDLEIATTTPGRNLKYPYGTLSGFYRPLINLDAKIGEVQIIDPGQFEAEEIRSSASSYLTKKWGKGNYTTSITKGMIEIMRIA